MTKRYRITYKQRFMGKVLTDSYIKTINNFNELIQAEQALRSDPHVFSVKWEEVEDGA